MDTESKLHTTERICSCSYSRISTVQLKVTRTKQIIGQTVRYYDAASLEVKYLMTPNTEWQHIIMSIV